MAWFRRGGDDEKVREWVILMKRRKAFNKTLKATVKEIIQQKSKRGVVGASSSNNLKHILLRIPDSNEALQHFIISLNLDVGNALEGLTSQQIKTHLMLVETENKKLKKENGSLKKRVLEKAQALPEPKRQNSAHIQNVDENHISVNGQLYCLKDYIESAYRRKHQQFSETLKTQNDLVDNLKQQLKGCKGERDNFSVLNKYLEDELKQFSAHQLKNESLKKHSEVSMEKYEEHELRIANLQQLLQHEKQTVDKMHQKLEVLKETVYNRDLKFEKLTNENQILLQQIARLEGDSKTSQYTLKEDIAKMGRLVDQLKQRLTKSNEELDFCKSQNNQFQQELLQHKQENVNVTEKRVYNSSSIITQADIESNRNIMENTQIEEQDQKSFSNGKNKSTDVQILDEHHISVNGQQYCLQDYIESANRKKHQQFAETLKTRNDLFENLKQQLTDCESQRDTFRIRNEHLEDELKQLNDHQLENERLKKHTEVSNNKICEEYQERIAKLQQLLQQQKQTLYDYDLKFEKLCNENQTLSQQLSCLEADSKKTHHSLEEDINRIKRVLDQLKQRLTKSNEELELCKTQNNHLQQKLLQLKKRNVNLDEGRVYNSKADIKISGDCKENKPIKNYSKEGQTDRNTAEESEDDEILIRNSLSEIKDVRKAIESINLEIQEFSGTRENKTFLHLKEMLIRNVLKLDNIETGGRRVIRQERKLVIERAQKLLDNLTAKAT